MRVGPEDEPLSAGEGADSSLPAGSLSVRFPSNPEEPTSWPQSGAALAAPAAMPRLANSDANLSPSCDSRHSAKNSNVTPQQRRTPALPAPEGGKESWRGQSGCNGQVQFLGNRDVKACPLRGLTLRQLE
jgi:hypothetical protein